MGHGAGGSGEGRGCSYGRVNVLQGNGTGGPVVGGRNMGHTGRNDECAGRFPPPHFLEDRGEDSMESQGGGLGVPPRGGGPRGGGIVANAGVRQVAADYYWRVHFYTNNI